ncbi:hypothetical protein ThidrDRAFT_1835 [Thiorhodococcus drewsii AZ1]|uniref:Uncharacterized protein n=1 Tax=Thiorhodococcus drewsii AZ1 TaxID=765913 RepID=G2E0L2_9GAMM|nr:hypothetical protein [Thiorhodococcus drewsii]EGV31634.1 hypothetical protein ThidrDRAFT_1835 [Thiorhodococcus drewsii AZ1]
MDSGARARDATADSKTAPDLSPPSHRLDPVFPHIISGTRVAIFTGEGGRLHANWALQPNDLSRFVDAFPPDGGTLFPVLRLQRLEAEGRSTPVEEKRLFLPGIGGEGETIFQFGQDHARFQVELGLVNANGGWLSLARSNGLQHVSSLGLPFYDDEGQTHVREGAGLLSYASEAKGSDGSLAIDHHGSVESTPADSSQGGVVRAPGAGAGEAESVDDEHRSACDAHGGLEQPSPQTETDHAFQIPRLDYGKPVSRGTQLLLEAELRIQGWAEPNSEIDLFGHRYLVGPGGRFQFLVKVDDPDLLRRALDLQPPPELSRPRED